MKKLLSIMSLSLIIGTVSFGQGLNLPSQNNVSHEKYNSNSVYTPYTVCGDFTATEENDNLNDGTPGKNSSNDIFNHVQQLNTILSPYIVRTENGHIYPPALTYLIFGVSEICIKNPDARLIDAVHKSASTLATIVNHSNEITKEDIKNNH